MSEPDREDGTLDLSRIKLSLWQAIVIWGMLLAAGAGIAKTAISVDASQAALVKIQNEIAQFRGAYETRLHALELVQARREGAEEQARKGGAR